jgi:ubiquinone/menaquinone biosynthesis C-methylase UbiE
MSAPSSSTSVHAAGAVFDRLAPSYDSEFTDSIIGRAQRNSVWKVLLRTFHAGDNILELNCGTGEDALFLAQHDISVFSCDASQAMILRAE